jgi:hypothetical protein
VLALLLALAGAAAPGPALADAVLAWNVTGFEATEAGDRRARTMISHAKRVSAGVWRNRRSS